MAFGLQTISESFKRGAATTFRFPVWGSQGGGGGSYASWADWLVDRLMPSADFDYVTEAGDLHKNAVVSDCLRFLIATFPEPMLVVKRAVPTDDPEAENGITEEIVTDHPLLMLLDAPNDDDDDSTAMAQSYCIDYNMFGNAYWLKLRNGSGRVVGLQPIPYKQMAPFADKTGVRRIGGYAYFVDGQAVGYQPREIIHFRFGRDPLNVRLGFQPLVGACRDICTENELSTLAASVARNMGIAPYLISPKATDEGAIMPVDQQHAIEEKFDSRTRDSRGRNVVMRRAMQVDRIGFSPDELMADKTRAVAVSRICGALGLDPMVVGLPSDSKTYSNYEEALTAAYHHNIIPVGDAYCTRLTRTFRFDAARGMGEPGYLAPNERLAWDYSHVKAMQEDADAKHTRIREDFKAGVCTRLEAKQALGMPYDEARDDVYIQDVTPIRGQAGDLEMTENGTGPTDAASKMYPVAGIVSKWRSRRQKVEAEYGALADDDAGDA